MSTESAPAAASAVPEPVGDQDFETPVLRIAVLRDESETLHNPAWDPVRTLEESFGWSVELFSERDYLTLLGVEHEFDCLVLGHNVLVRRPDIVEAFAGTSLTAGILLLQQKTLYRGLHLDGGLDVGLEDFDTPVHDVQVAVNRDPLQEILLNWPCPVTTSPEVFACDAVRGFVLPGHSSWRVVLEAMVGDRRIPVLVRSPASNERGIVATTLLLEPHRAQHRHLLCNAVSLCAGGRPDTIVMSGDPAWRGIVARKLRLRGISTVSLASGSRPPSFDDWPLRGVAQVFVLASEAERGLWASQPAVGRWLEAGGRLVQVHVDGRTETTFEAPDIHWVARRFGSLLNATGESWTNSILASRGVLTVLVEFEDQRADDLRRFGIAPVQSHRQAIRRLVIRRLGSGDNVDNTVSTTVALLDLEELLPGLLEPDERSRIQRWLRDGHVDMALDDQLEVARALKDDELLAATVAMVPNPTDLTAATRLRRASTALKHEGDPLHGRSLTPLARSELTSSVLVAAEYLASLARTAVEPRRIPEEEAPLIEIAIATLRKRGVIVGNDRASQASVEEIAAEARAVAAISRLDPTAVGIADRDGQLPPTLVDDVLRETARLRADNSIHTAKLRTQKRTLVIAQHALTAVVLLVALAAAVLLSSGVETTGDVLAAVTGFVGIALVLAYVLFTVDLLPPWTVRFVAWIGATRSAITVWTTGLTGTEERRGDDERDPYK